MVTWLAWTSPNKYMNKWRLYNSVHFPANHVFTEDRNGHRLRTLWRRAGTKKVWFCLETRWEKPESWRNTIDFTITNWFHCFWDILSTWYWKSGRKHVGKTDVVWPNRMVRLMIVGKKPGNKTEFTFYLSGIVWASRFSQDGGSQKDKTICVKFAELSSLWTTVDARAFSRTWNAKPEVSRRVGKCPDFNHHTDVDGWWNRRHKRHIFTVRLWGTVVTPCHPSSGAGPMVPWHPGGPSGTIQSSGGKCPVPAANSEERCHENKKRCHPTRGWSLGRFIMIFQSLAYGILMDIDGYCIFTLWTIEIYIVMGYLTIVMGKLNHDLTGFPSPGNHGW